ncbi:TatD family deoxyribonuclease [Moritella marina ATCC 15381]|uniref:TatD family deoxyribonuclease n=1 Tax=Moritella marina ATCC 15381 TaxID=1202962 RepID=A0A5J6WPM9_MORMI|nr:TatD family hydrolase [Moritella marina]QFI40106.1 TatD family deoxyribonuclease [Moritella marina ATCC 15381]
MIELVDSHCHLDFSDFDLDRIDVLARAKAKGVEHFLVPGIGAHNWQSVLALANQHTGVYAALGIHPYFLANFDHSHLVLLDEYLATEKGVVAVGEFGLDKIVDFPFEQQLHICKQQLLLAKQYDLPVILHCRKAHNELIQLLQQVKLPRGGVIHGFSGSKQLAMQYIKLGFKLGIGGVITYPRAEKTRQAVSELPLAALLLETDSPDMPIKGYQGGRNEPANITEVLQELAKLRPESEKVIAKTNLSSFIELFLS